jgi:predicted metal-dependent RNase
MTMTTKKHDRSELLRRVGSRGAIKPQGDWPKWMLMAFFLGQCEKVGRSAALVRTMAAIMVHELKYSKQQSA